MLLIMRDIELVGFGVGAVASCSTWVSNLVKENGPVTQLLVLSLRLAIALVISL